MAEEKPEHVELYDSIEDSVDVKDLIKRHKKHTKGRAKALAHIEGLDPANLNEGLEHIADAIIKYHKAAGLPIDDSEHARHMIHGEITQRLEQLYEENGFEGLEKEFKTGDYVTALEKLMNTYKAQDLNRAIDYRVHKLVPNDKDPDFYGDVIKHHGKVTDTKFTKGKIVSLSNPRAVKGLLTRLYNTKLNEKIEQYEAKQEEKKAA